MNKQNSLFYSHPSPPGRENRLFIAMLNARKSAATRPPSGRRLGLVRLVAPHAEFAPGRRGKVDPDDTLAHPRRKASQQDASDAGIAAVPQETPSLPRPPHPAASKSIGDCAAPPDEGSMDAIPQRSVDACGFDNFLATAISRDGSKSLFSALRSPTLGTQATGVQDLNPLVACAGITLNAKLETAKGTSTMGSSSQESSRPRPIQLTPDRPISCALPRPSA